VSVLLHVEGLNAGYGAIRVLHDIDLDVAAGEVVAILGANGAGKTTILRAISAMIPYQGTISFCGSSMRRCGTHTLARLGMAHVPEHRGTFAELTVDENLTLGAYAARGSAVEIAQTREIIFKYFPRLVERRHQQAGSLSGGEQQMLAIGRALALRPKLLLLDEPSFGLAPQIVQEIYRILQDLKRDAAVGILLVEQHAGLALELADRALVLASGKIVLSGTAQGIKNDPRVQENYFGAGPH
jgi:branched-chain amino acid transport system ATP-binding protein